MYFLAYLFTDKNYFYFINATKKVKKLEYVLQSCVI